MSWYSYVPLTEPQLNLCTQMGVMYYCENAYLLRHRPLHTCASTAFHQMDSVKKVVHCKAKHILNLNSNPTLLDAKNVTLLSKPS